MALVVEQCSTLEEAVDIIRQDFSPRALKSYLALLARLKIPRESDTRRTAEELISLAVRILRYLDKRLKSKITNHCRCQIGERKFQPDYNHLLVDAFEFYKKFKVPIEDCEVNDFLQLDKVKGRGPKLLEQEKIADFNLLNYVQRRSQVNSLRTSKLLYLQTHGYSKAYQREKKFYRITDAYIHLSHLERANCIKEVAECVVSDNRLSHPAVATN